MSHQLTPSEIEQEYNALSIEAEQYKWDLDQANAHNYTLAEAVSAAVNDLRSLKDVPLRDVEESIDILIESLREAL